MKHLRQLLLIPFAILVLPLYCTLGWLLAYLFYGWEFSKGYVERRINEWWIL